MRYAVADLRRRLALRKAPPGPLRDYLKTPFPRPSAPLEAVRLLAIDIETTGLDPRRDDVLSLGFVTVEGNRIDLASACHRLIRTARAIPEASAIVHRITDDLAAQGGLLDDVLAEFLGALAGKVMIAHHASVEKGFLGDACKRVYGLGLPVRVIDTQALAKRSFERHHIAFKPRDLRLDALSNRYNLPRFGAHNALNDALAAAELFLAQAAYGRGGGRARLRDFLT